MPLILFADNFLASSLLTLLMPVSLVITLAVWYTRTVRRVPTDTPQDSVVLPTSDAVAAAGETPHEVKPAGPPPGEIR